MRAVGCIFSADARGGIPCHQTSHPPFGVPFQGSREYVIGADENIRPFANAGRNFPTHSRHAPPALSSASVYQPPTAVPSPDSRSVCHLHALSRSSIPGRAFRPGWNQCEPLPGRLIFTFQLLVAVPRGSHLVPLSLDRQHPLETNWGSSAWVLRFGVRTRRCI